MTAISASLASPHRNKMVAQMTAIDAKQNPTQCWRRLALSLGHGLLRVITAKTVYATANPTPEASPPANPIWRLKSHPTKPPKAATTSRSNQRDCVFISLWRVATHSKSL